MNLEDIDWLISQIPLRNYVIKDGDLDSRFLIEKGYPHDLHPRSLNFNVRARRIVNLLRRILEAYPEQLTEFDYSESNLEHFIRTMQRNYAKDKDVRELLEIQTLQNIIRLAKKLD